MIPGDREAPAQPPPALFAAATALAAFLLFDVQLFAGKELLPLFGGAPAVWLTCLLFFQAILLAGYGWAHALALRASPRAQGAAHAALLLGAVALLVVHRARWGSPLLSADAGAGDPAHPAGELLRRLASGLGAPALALAATAPLLQAWHARLRPAESPYRLYAWSNFGSLAGLAAFVFVFEPLLPLSRQATLWSALFAVEAIALGFLARAVAARSRPARAASEAAAAAPPGRERALWLLLPAAGSAALLAFTHQICQEIAVLPLLWVLPLALYLLSWMLAFAGPRWRARRLTAPALVAGLVLAAVVLYYQLDIPALPQIAALALALFGVALACHGEVARLQPSPRHLTAYYLSGAAGGALGGLFVAALAPRLFTGLWELHLALLAAAIGYVGALAADRELFRDGRVGGGLAALVVAGLLAAALVGAAIATGAATHGTPGSSRERLFLLAGTAAVVLYLIWRLRRREIAPRFAAFLALTLAIGIYAGVLRTHAAALDAGSRVALRDFFATVRVREVAPDDPEEHAYWLLHGRIAHGFQFALADYRALPTSYYAAESGVALALARHPARLATPPRPLRVGVLGLGIGTVATHAAAGDRFRFFEISPSVVRLARGEGGYFSYLRDSKAAIEIVPGDARVSLERERRDGGPPPYDVLVLDAFASGTVPVHLLTREALRTDLDRLAAPDGILAINVSNRALDLPKLVARLAADAGLSGVVVESGASWDGATWHAIWILLARDAATLADPEIAAHASPLPAPPDDAPLWTDDHSSLLGLLRPEAW